MGQVPPLRQIEANLFIDETRFGFRVGVEFTGLGFKQLVGTNAEDRDPGLVKLTFMHLANFMAAGGVPREDLDLALDSVYEGDDGTDEAEPPVEPDA